ncbi:hypothetical protein NCLIV_045260 [Neospora caninum Liverpool]|uniref:Uncharacterized protein n=1 Tax=Neospora caninum (strain Liverpool) TaxID=572307 RepID=F0VLG5_NEOCL|nr:hypothetical protein NCLIV_045260 [Neospora caninum Liverpool]CBZ54093.1 hypothetical protein NCLIV_045260 [Neospora caninum Liverpool]|eukprot:XP_003884124.1 hypothetical protein NCLIV_045260 [Neospora caninum Liverpool]
MEGLIRPVVAFRRQNIRSRHFFWLLALISMFLLLTSWSYRGRRTISWAGIPRYTGFAEAAGQSADSLGGSDRLPQERGMQPRRLSSIVKKFVVWEPVHRLMPSLNLDSVVFVAGKHKADRSAAFHATMDDVMTLFLRWFNENGNMNWLLQSFVTEAALLRAHSRYQDQMIHEQTQSESERPTSPEDNMNKLLNVEVYTYLAAAKRRVRDWVCDGNSFLRTGEEGRDLAKKPLLTERDAGFLRGLPYSVLRVARGVYADTLPASVERLQEELYHRDVRTVDDLLMKTNIIDLFVLFDVTDESFTQIDVLREVARNWELAREGRLVPPLLPPGTWKGKRSLEDLIRDGHYPSMKFPKCTTLKCVMQETWSEHSVDTISVEKTDTNSLKLLLVGNTGIGEYKHRAKRKGFWYSLKRFLWANEIDQVVAALKTWHEKEKADAVLGLGDFFGIPGPLSARDERFSTKWYDVFVKDAGLDIPWLMTLGDEEALVNPSASIRHHYTQEHQNWYMPSDAYTVTFNFTANMTMADGTIQQESFNATVININTWSLFVGNPVGESSISRNGTLLVCDVFLPFCSFPSRLRFEKHM